MIGNMTQTPTAEAVAEAADAIRREWIANADMSDRFARANAAALRRVTVTVTGPRSVRVSLPGEWKTPYAAYRATCDLLDHATDRAGAPVGEIVDIPGAGTIREVRW